jgi:hypothetical protein
MQSAAQLLIDLGAETVTEGVTGRPTAKTTEGTRAFVCVPRVVAPTYWATPWADVLEAAEHGVDGLTRQFETPVLWVGRPDEPAEPPDVAFLREGDGDWGKGRTLLYQQNW